MGVPPTRKRRGKTEGTESKVDIETTAYCACGRCCGWNWGIAIRPFPVYLPLAVKKRASGFRPVPVVPRKRIGHAGEKDLDFVRGALVIGAMGAVVGAAASMGVGRVFRGLPPCNDRWTSPDEARNHLLASMGRGFGIGAFAGGTMMPVSRFWSETRLAGKAYECRTSTNLEPREPKHPLFSYESLTRPWKIPWKICSFQWFGRDGTIAADTKHHSYGTRMYVKGWGWGVVEDIGGAIKGQKRIDLFYNSHTEALKWGRKKCPVRVYTYRI